MLQRCITFGLLLGVMWASHGHSVRSNDVRVWTDAENVMHVQCDGKDVRIEDTAEETNRFGFRHVLGGILFPSVVALAAYEFTDNVLDISRETAGFIAAIYGACACGLQVMYADQNIDFKRKTHSCDFDDCAHVHDYYEASESRSVKERHAR